MDKSIVLLEGRYNIVLQNIPRSLQLTQNLPFMDCCPLGIGDSQRLTSGFSCISFQAAPISAGDSPNRSLIGPIGQVAKSEWAQNVSTMLKSTYLSIDHMGLYECSYVSNVSIYWHVM